MLAWLRRGAYAAQLAGDRADLWPAGALAWLAYLGWIPLLVVVAQPDPNDLAFIGVSLYSTSAFPGNVITLSVAVVVGFAALCLVAAAAEVALLRSAGAPTSARPPLARATLTTFTVVLVCGLPAVGAMGAVLLGLISAAPSEFLSPEIETSVLLRLAVDLAPLLVLLLAALLAGQTVGGIALRRTQAAPEPVTSALAAAARDLSSRPWTRVGVAAAGLLADAAAALLTFLLLRILWAPIASALDAGRLASPDTLVLLLGFVAIWLALLLAAGALHVAVSAWWALELARSGRRSALPAGVGAGEPRMGSDTGGGP
jgi:hypothetical protein